MEYQIVDVEYDDGITDVARIIRDELDFYVISPLEYSGNFCKFDEEYIAVPKESISGFYDTTDLEDTGLFRKLSNGVYESLDESDPDFEYDEEIEVLTDALAQIRLENDEEKLKEMMRDL